MDEINTTPQISTAINVGFIVLCLFLWSHEASAFTISKPSVNNTGLVGWWTFDGKDITSGRANDVSGNANHGSLVNIATSTFYTAGKLGQGFNFDGVDDYLTIADNDNLEGGTQKTLSAWVKLTSAPASFGLILEKENHNLIKA